MYPPSDLLSLVVGAYFQHVNLFYPLLHRPSFEASISLGLHLRDRGFGTVVLAVCALGSRFLTDPRVHLEMAPNASPGWKYISQVPPVPRGFMTITTLYDMQYYCVCWLVLPPNDPADKISVVGDDLLSWYINAPYRLEPRRIWPQVHTRARVSQAKVKEPQANSGGRIMEENFLVCHLLRLAELC